jgi:transcriptional regulator with PAS, ATPase and Fis domain
VVLLTSSMLRAECAAHLDATCDILIARRTLNFACLGQLYALPPKSSILVVNDVRETALEVVELLKQIGFTRFRYQAHYPGCTVKHAPYKYVIATRRFPHIPKDAKNIIEIGSRILDITSIVEVVKSLDLVSDDMQEKINSISIKYMKEIIFLGHELHGKSEHLKQMNEFLVRMINGITDGILSYDPRGRVILINHIAASLLKINAGANLLAKSGEANPALQAFIQNDLLHDLLLQINDTTYFVSKLPNQMDNSCLLTIKNVRERINMENSLKKELKRQGHHAKYSFQDLIHSSPLIHALIKKATKLAESEFNIMIHGESGTGKEIVASAIHNASRRKDGPFLAVNCSALPDELIESELFGYEEGAFTGAKKGGKVGLFELANQGTLFLDEIGDISPKIQSRLLRVLQEKEVLRVGGNRNTPVDVRIVAATNRNLSDLVKQGVFREDLYYRLKKLYLQIPPLRERREDILPIFFHFITQKNGAELKITEDARNLLASYPWPGNVRELESCAEYILAVRESDLIDRTMLSEDLLEASPGLPESQIRLTAFILRAIRKANHGKALLGRAKLTELAVKARFGVTEHQMRTALDQLAARGLLQMGRGRIGLRLTPEGLAHLNGGPGMVTGA